MKRIVAIFAHPDDEAFGPGGTIAKLAKTSEVYLICATKGEVGLEKGRKASKNLPKIREQELLRAAKILGIKKVFFLGFRDGDLSNNLYHQIAQTTEVILRKLKPETILTYEPRGISGHIDHMTIAMVSLYLFHRLPFIKTILQLCRPSERDRARQDYFIYVPPGYQKKDIGLVVDVSSVWDQKVRAMMAHQSQIGDVKYMLKFVERFPKKEYFLVTKK
ncbi:MAG: PIG-L family deacetylase [Candidatus Sungbacteria bacterium]|uniref:PIG-L family deacetylase n=1 Tax=Candidatus Sungiibacteriota bacterium TaxID=2750080 RepID=A0A9D6LSD3_9BACT|nr:PIG-L family deacetylase [Candidatus Sungbacteria bacterium]